MSWSGYATIPKGSTTEEIYTILEGMTFSGQTDMEEAKLAQNEAKEAAKALIYSGALGLSDQYGFTVSLGGHANADHVQTGNWSRDTISVSVSQTE